MRRALELLALSRVVHPVVHTSASGLRLGAGRDERYFKALFLDIGLVNRLCGLDLLGAEDLITVNEGALAEQFVGQQLLCAAPAFENPQLLYWARETRNANAEVAFVISRNQEMEKSGAMAAVGGPQPKGRLPRRDTKTLLPRRPTKRVTAI